MRTLKWKPVLFILALCVIVGTSLKAHNSLIVFGDHAVESSFLESNGLTLACNIDGKTFTHARILYKNGDVMSDYWITDPKDPEVVMTAILHGRGWVQSFCNGTIAGNPSGSHVYGSASQVGSWGAVLIPWSINAHDYVYENSFEGKFAKTPYKTYTWKGGGSIKLTPTYWSRRWGINISKSSGVGVTGEWKNGIAGEYATPKDEDGAWNSGGSWVVTLDESRLSYNRNDGNGNPGNTGGTGGSNTPGDSSNTVNPSASLSGSSSASAGDRVTFELSTATAFSSVYWYVAGPGESGLGSHIETDTGSSSSTTESFTYTFGSSDSGDYVITAYIYNYSDNSTYETSTTVSVSSSSDTPPSSGGTTPPDPPAPNPPTPPSPLVQCLLCGTSYDPNSDISRHTETFTCDRPGCGLTYTACTDWEGACLHSGSSRHSAARQ